MELGFEWDDEKAKQNLQKHGVSFESATMVFYDENRIEIFDAAHSTEEERYITIGLAGTVLFVVYTERHANIRLISARPATLSERKVYYDSNL